MKNRFSLGTSFILLALFTPIILRAEGLSFLRSSGKIYVVVSILVITFIGIVIYLWRLENRIRKTEEKLK